MTLDVPSFIVVHSWPSLSRTGDIRGKDEAFMRAQAFLPYRSVCRYRLVSMVTREVQQRRVQKSPAMPSSLIYILSLFRKD